MYKLYKIFVVLLIFGILSILMPFFELIRAEEPCLPFLSIESLETNLSLIQNNALLPISSPLSPETQDLQKINVVITAYSSSPWETWGDPFITASNSYVRKGIVANNMLAFGTKIRIPEIYGDEIFVVEDRMHYRKGSYHVDIWFPSYLEAKDFGAKRTYIEILET